MKKKQLNNFIIFLRFFSILFTFLFIGQLNAKDLSKIQEDDWVLGDENAPITMIEYASLSCPHCAAFHINTLPKIKKEYIETGKVKFVFRAFPFNLPALHASMIARCAGQELYYKYLNALFSLQKSWVKENFQEYLFKIVQNGGTTKEEFDLCLMDENLQNQILENQIRANKEYNIKTTPSFIINGKLIEGNKSLDAFKKIFDKILLQIEQ